ncbi:MAG TPA: CocE/NonD family hydrolase [Solirubrobacteraceae bacterium]|nr:CocE/NonD family hydrolase [Solirubrobacteraceae bacterium]
MRCGQARASVVAMAAAAALAGAGPAAAAVSAHGSVQQVYAVGLARGTRATLVNAAGRVVAFARADSLGGVVLRGVAPGRGYRLIARAAGARRAARSGPLTVLADRPAPPSTRIYDQRLPAGGYGYLRTRDGTLLAIDVRLPGPASAGPYPTLMEYSGYGYADPAGPQSGIAPIANLLGFAVVDVNMRGTGCSGGSFDYFEPLQSLDGYDAIETIARQPWVLGHRVGMLGISYGGISQLFVAATDPPHLAAIAPLSVIDSTATTLYPGGLLNTGFAVPWALARMHDALPASPHGGQAWAWQRIRHGDRICAANQVLHGEAPNLLAQIRANRYYVPSVADPLAPITFVARIHVPVFLACQWEDEQTGGHCADLAQHFTGTRDAYFTFTNGTHIDSLDPLTFDRWYDFLKLYVAHRAPRIPAGVAAFAPAVFAATMGIGNVTLPADPIQSEPSYPAALAAFRRAGRVRVLFDNGAGSPAPGAPYPGFVASFSRFPAPGTRARAWYLNADGQLSDRPAAHPGADRFSWDPRARPATSFTGPDDGAAGGLWTASPPYRWAQSPPGTAASYLTAPLTADTVVIGGGAVTVWVRSSAPTVDLQATISEVRPDGRETFVQDGWVRASERALAPQSTPLEPALSLLRSQVAPLPRGRFTPVTIPLYFEGHVYRRGSRIRLTISAPGGDQPVWAFADTLPRGRARVWIAASSRLRSRLLLPVVPGVRVPTPLPPCPGLRGEPCRAYIPYRDLAGRL